MYHNDTRIAIYKYFLDTKWLPPGILQRHLTEFYMRLYFCIPIAIAMHKYITL